MNSLSQILLTDGLQLAERDGAILVTPAEAGVKLLEDLIKRERSDGGLRPPDLDQLDLTDAEGRQFFEMWLEADKCFRAGAYLASTVMLGSLLESLLLLALKRNRDAVKEANVRRFDDKNMERPIERWSLNEMIEACAEMGWTAQRVKAFSHSLREFRNLVHPELRKRETDLPRTDECLIS